MKGRRMGREDEMREEREVEEGLMGKWGDEREEVKVSEENSDDSVAMKDKRCSLCGPFLWSLY